MRFDLVDLRLFLFVAESGSITLGAERAGLALASASARIKGMEESLGYLLNPPGALIRRAEWREWLGVH